MPHRNLYKRQWDSPVRDGLVFDDFFKNPITCNNLLSLPCSPGQEDRGAVSIFGEGFVDFTLLYIYIYYIQQLKFSKISAQSLIH